MGRHTREVRRLRHGSLRGAPEDAEIVERRGDGGGGIIRQGFEVTADAGPPRHSGASHGFAAALETETHRRAEHSGESAIPAHAFLEQHLRSE